MIEWVRRLCLRPAVRYVLIVATVVLWIVGLGDQIDDPAKVVKYVAISLLMVAVARIR